MGLEGSQRKWLALVRDAAAGRAAVAGAMRKLTAAARRGDPDHPAWEDVASYDFAADAARIAVGVRRVLAARQLTPEYRQIVFELDPVNLAGDGAINVFARGGDDVGGDDDDGDHDAEIDLGVVRSRVLGKLYDWAEDGDAADVLVGFGFTAVAIARALRGAGRSASRRRISLAYHDSGIEPLVLGEVTPRGFGSGGRGRR